jgi:hypothetical protein
MRIHDASMREAGCVQSKEICILGKHYAAILGSAFQMSRILGCLQAEFLNRDYIHASPTQSFRHGFRDMLVHLARIIHDDFYCNRRYAAATSLTAGWLAAQSVNILFQVCFPPSRLRAPVSHGVLTVSSRTLVNNAG